jgi:hypothetical protein
MPFEGLFRGLVLIAPHADEPVGLRRQRFNAGCYAIDLCPCDYCACLTLNLGGAIFCFPFGHRHRGPLNDHHRPDIILEITRCVRLAGFLDGLTGHLEHNPEMRNPLAWLSQRFDALSDPIDLRFARHQNL